MPNRYTPGMAERTGWRFDVRSSLLTLVVVGAGALIYHAWLLETAPPPPPEARVVDLGRIARFKLGMQGVLRDPLRGGVYVGRTREDYTAYAKAQVARDQVEQRMVSASGRAYRVANGNAAEIRGKDPTGLIRVRILGGDHGGEVSWTSGEFFNPDTTNAQVPADDGADIMGGP